MSQLSISFAWCNYALDVHALQTFHAWAAMYGVMSIAPPIIFLEAPLVEPALQRAAQRASRRDCSVNSFAGRAPPSNTTTGSAPAPRRQNSTSISGLSSASRAEVERNSASA
eukprot:TRINITY_DN51879_c0_g1_i1.p2 TRINITY_DN51879_c0_g1~~TRINITY_DN51879_c0_g1_i1.p2  ORF type:complete len:112 (+),score=18.13 TRINITY_DN51879_c0_g1_i1:163-498(+)